MQTKDYIEYSTKIIVSKIYNLRTGPKSVKILFLLYTKLIQMINLQFPKKALLATIKMANINLNTHDFFTLLN